MRIQFVRIIALLWLAGTFYITFLLFSTKTSLKGINWIGDLNSRGHQRSDLDKVKDNDKVTKHPVHIVRQKKPDKFKEIFNHTLNSRGWTKYSKYKSGTSLRVFPLVNDKEDRVLNQIHTVPSIDRSKLPKTIFMRWGLDGMTKGRIQFINHQCPINWCHLTDNHLDEPRADLIFYKDFISPVTHRNNSNEFNMSRNPNQVTLLFQLESPQHGGINLGSVNWTATYRTDSVINTPYEKYAFFKNFTGQLPSKPLRNFAEGKTKKVAWFVSNCFTSNGRLEYVKELQKYIDVDIFGTCGTLSCLRDVDKCDDILKKNYKFYLSFENSNCKDYITEKFFTNALGNDILPVVMGARPDDYKKLAPPGSYIHVDEFDSPQDLAAYLHMLDANDDMYNKYFLWKGSGELIDTKFWCRLCSLLHERDKSGVRMWYNDLNKWWDGPGACHQTSGDIRDNSVPHKWASWNNFTDTTFDASGTFRFIKSIHRH